MAVIKNVPKVILVHNHPSGNLLPSEQDIAITEELKKAGDILGIKILDHLIITETSFTSIFTIIA